MIIKDYQEFVQNNNGSKPILENVKAAKAYLFKRALQEVESKNPELALLIRSQASDANQLDKIIQSSSPENEPVKRIAKRIKAQVEDNQELETIKKLLTEGGENSPGYTYLFLKFRLDEDIPVEELKKLLNKLKEYSPYLSQLPMQLDKYSQLTPTSEDERGGYERLEDDLENLRQIRATDRFVRELPNDFVVKGVPGQPPPPDEGKTVPSLKKAYADAPDELKREVQNIALQFDKFGEKDGISDEQKSKKFRDQFFAIIRSCRNIHDVIDRAKKHLKGALLKEFEYLAMIDSVNKKFGEINGAKVLYFSKGVLVTNVKSFQANQALNGDTSHCIARNLSHWESYVSAEGRYNNQYYIRNFNLGPEEPESVIGVTINPKSEIVACFDKPNGNFSTRFASYVNRLGLDMKELFKPMSKAEIEEKKKRDTANKTIVKSGITLEQLKECIEYGGDPNASNGRPLSNAVAESSITKIRYLLEQGANAKIGRPMDKIKKSEGEEAIEIIKLLAMNGAQITADIFDLIINEFDVLSEIIKSGGLEMKEEGSMALRRAALIGTPESNLKGIPKDKVQELTMKTFELLLNYGADPSSRNWYVLRSLSEYGKLEVLEYVMQVAKRKGLAPTAEQWRKITTYAKTSDLETKKKNQIVKWIDAQATSA